MDTFRLHKEKEKATILASAKITVAERRGIGGYVEASNGVADTSRRGTLGHDHLRSRVQQVAAVKVRTPTNSSPCAGCP